MKKITLLFITVFALSISLNSCVEECEGECEIDKNGKLDCPCDDI